MKIKIVLGALLGTMLASCSSVYKSSQTPDDVYYSPAKASVAKANAQEDKYEDYVSSQDDQYLRMKVANRQRWSSLDDYSYWNDSRFVPSYSYSYYANNWNSPYAWNNLYSPYSASVYFGGFNSFGYYSPYSFYNPYTYGYYPYSSYSKVYVPVYSNPIHSNVNRPNLNGYSNRRYSNYNNTGVGTNRPSLGSSIRRVFAPTQSDNYNRNSNNNTYRAPERTYTPSSPSRSSSSSSGSSSSGSSGSVSRPTRSH